VIVVEELTRTENTVGLSVTFNTSAPLRRTNFKARFDLVKANAGLDYSAKRVKLLAGIVDKFRNETELHNIAELVEKVPSPADVYGQWLFHGPIFQGIQSVRLLGRDGIVGSVKGAAESTCFKETNGDQWFIDPVLFDSSMQLAGVWARQLLDITVLPTGFKTLHLFSPIEAGEELIARVYVRPEATARELICELALYHQNGEMAMLVEALGGIGSKSLNRLASQNTPLGTTR
jgi:hypothetical protein